MSGRKNRRNPYAAWGWDYVGGIEDIDKDIDMQGHGIVNMKDPTEPQDAVTKKYVDEKIAQGGGGGGGVVGPVQASAVQLTPVGNIQATNVQEAFAEMTREAAIKDQANVFTQEQTMGGATISEAPDAVPYNVPYASPTGKVTKISSQNNVDFETPGITLRGDLIPADTIKHTARSGGAIQGANVQQALDSADVLIKQVKGDYVEKTGLTEDFSAQTHKITDLANGTDNGDAVNVSQLNSKADASDLTALQGKVTQNTNDITSIKSGATKLDSANVTFTPEASGVLAGKTNVQEALVLTDSLVKGNQASITTLQTESAKHLTKSGGVLESNLNASGYVITGLGAPSSGQDSVNRQYVDDAINAIKQALAGQLQWAGTYDCQTSQIKTLSDVGERLTDAQGQKVFTVGQNLPTASATINNYYFIAVNKTPHVPNINNITSPLSAGDWIIGDTTDWRVIEMAKAITATNVSFTNTGSSLNAQDVQGAIVEVDANITTLKTQIENIVNGTNKISAENVSYTEKAGGVVKGVTVQDAITSADGVIATTKTIAETNKTDIVTINTTLQNVAKLAVANTFTEANKFTLVPTTDGNPSNPTDLATVKYIDDKIIALKATQVTFDPATSGLGVNTVQGALDKVSDASNIKFRSTTQMTQTEVSTALDHLNTQIQQASNKKVSATDVSIDTTNFASIKGTNVHQAFEKTDQIIGMVSDYVVENSSLVGTYDAQNNRILSLYGQALKLTAEFQVGGALPVSGDKNKSFYFVVKNGGTGQGQAPAEEFKSGDLIRSNGQRWERIDSSAIKTASEIGISSIANVTANNVQEALESLATQQRQQIIASNVNIDPAIPELSGGTVQAVLSSVALKFGNVNQTVTDLTNRVDGITATTVPYDNSETNFPQIQGQNVANVQKAIEAVNSKIATLPTTLEASNVSFNSTAGLTSTNVAQALDELKNADNAFLTKSGGVLAGDLNAGVHKITNLNAPGNPNDAARKADVDAVVTASDNKYILKSGGVLGSDLNANNKKITGLATPTSDDHASNKTYVDTRVDTSITTLSNSVDAKYLKLAGGTLSGDLRLGGRNLKDLGEPTDNNDAVRKSYIEAHFVKQNGGVLTGTLNAGTNWISGLKDATSPDHAVNKKILDQAIRDVQGQLTGRLTYCGTYNASNNTIASVSSAGTTNGFVVGQALPADSANIDNCFFIVSVAGVGSGNAPAEQLGIGDIVLAQGGDGWLNVPIGSTRTASNVSVTAIQQLAGATNVQQALEQLASRPSGGASTASQVVFTPTGGIQANNVQDALREVDSETVKLTGSQTVRGVKTYNDAVFFNDSGYSPIAITKARPTNAETVRIEWKNGVNGPRYASQGFTSTSQGYKYAMIFAITPENDPANPPFFVFSQIVQYDPGVEPTEERHFTHKKYVDQAIATSTTGFLPLAGGTMTGALNMGGQKITNVGAPTNANDVVTKTFGENNYVMTTGTQEVRGRKKLVNGIDIKSGNGFAFNVDHGQSSTLQWWTGDGGARYFYLGFESSQQDKKNTFTFNMVNDTADAPAKFVFSHIAKYRNESTQPSDPTHLVTKKYVDDAVSGAGGGGLKIEAVRDVDVTSAFPGLSGLGTALYTHKLIKDTTDGSVLSALFGLKLTLTATWTPVVSNTPSKFPGSAHIEGDQYYKGLPLLPDTSLSSSLYKTVAYLNMYQCAPASGSNIVFDPRPINLGRIVCLGKSTGTGATELYVVFTHNQALTPVVRNGFYVMRYEGLPAIPL